MKLRLLFLVYLGLMVSLSGLEKDPFGPVDDSKWQEAISKSKPYVLEFASIETADSEPYEVGEGGFFTEASDDDFEDAERIEFNVSSDESGRIETTDGTKVFYRIQKEGAVFNIDYVYHTSIDGNLREFSSELTLEKDKWLVFGGLTRTDIKALSDGTEIRSKLNFYTGVRIRAHVEETSSE